MSGRMTFLRCVCLTLAGVFILALAPGLSGVPPENASARDKGQVKSAASRLVTSPVNQVGQQIRNEGGVATAATINFRWLPAQVGAYPAGTTGENTADLTIFGAPAAGQPLWLAIYIGNWEPNSANGKLKNWNAQLDASSLPAGLAPWRPFCPDDDDPNNDPDAADELCFALMGPGVGAGCDVAPINADQCAPAFQDYSRADLIEAWGFPGCNIATENLKCGGNVGAEPNHTDPGVEDYGATLVLLAEQSLVGGPHSIDFVPPGPDTFMNDGATLIKVNTATLTVDPQIDVDCCNGTTCQTLAFKQCRDSGGTVVTQCLGDNNSISGDDTCDGIIPPGEDCWRTNCGRTKFSFSGNPIPADFFGPGSEPFDGVVTLGGGGAGDFDTSMRRLEQMLLEPPPSSDSTPIELVALDLISCVPIDVGFGGNPSQQWNVSVKQSTAASPLGTLTVNREHDNGGVFTAEFFVQPVFTFTRVADPNDVRILDTAAEGIPPALLKTFGEAPYVHRLGAGRPVFTCGTNFAPGVEEDLQTGDQCCRKVGHSAGPGSPPGHIHETAPPDCTACPSGACCLPNGDCQVAEPLGAPAPAGAQRVCEVTLGGEYKGNSTDCSDSDGDGLADILENGTGGESCPVGDPCNLGTNPGLNDTDLDGCSDGEEVSGGSDPCDSCDFLSACLDPALDCNNNGVPDTCDIRVGTNDSNNNGVVDACEETACCRTVQGFPLCQNLTDSECFDVGGVRQPLGLLCPPGRTSTASHTSGPFTHLTDPALECPAGIAIAGGGCIPGDPIDPWKTAADAELCHIFGLDPGACPPEEPNCSPPIPADFFGPGSDPYGSPAPEEVCLKGEPLGPVPPFGEFGEADTLIRRTGGPEGTGDPFNRCDLPSGKEHTVTVEVVALNLVSTAPITVTFNGGQNPEQWDVAVDLSQTSPDQPGSITAVKTHCNGGTYDSELHVQPRFTFTKVGDPGQVRVLDTGLEDIPFVTLTQVDAQWTSDIAENFGWPSEICTDFHPGIEDADPITDCNCNGNDSRDKCDIERQESLDCNDNGVPDECELTDNDCNINEIPDDCEDDCNQNDVPDSCDVDGSDPDGNGLVSADCNSNGIPDECEADCNHNGVPDACDLLVFETSEDCTGNSRPDECDIRSGTSPDCQPNGIPDDCDIAAGSSADLNGDGVPDECQARGACCDDATGVCTNDVAPENCLLGRRYGGDGSTCSSIDPPCGLTGACCNDATAVCTNDVTQSICEGSGRRYGGNGTDCATIDPPCGQLPTIPTISEWGLVILTLLLLTGAKIYFGRRRAPV